MTSAFTTIPPRPRTAARSTEMCSERTTTASSCTARRQCIRSLAPQYGRFVRTSCCTWRSEYSSALIRTLRTRCSSRHVELNGKCSAGQAALKGYLARWIAKTAILVPETKDTVIALLQASAKAAAQSCALINGEVTCGDKWYVDGWDGTSSIGQQLSALETFQALLASEGGQRLTQNGVVLKGQSRWTGGANEPALAPPSSWSSTTPMPSKSMSAPMSEAAPP